MDESGEAPVPPESPLISTLSAWALATPAAIGADADFRHELDGHRRVRIGILQIENELRQIFDGIDVMVRRRRNQLHARASHSATAR